MKKVRITVMKMGCYPDLMAEYENPMEHPCDMVLGQVFVADGWNRPEGPVSYTHLRAHET